MLATPSLAPSYLLVTGHTQAGAPLAGAARGNELAQPSGTWIDQEAAAEAAHLAERALRAGHPDEANGWTLWLSAGWERLWRAW